MMEKKNKQLLVEGNDDLHVIRSLCKKHDIPETFDIFDCKGITLLLDAIPVRLKQSEIETLGIIVDADIDLNNRWESVSQILADKGYKVPETIPTGGLILRENGKVTIGAWLMPNNNSNGMLEDFIRFLIPGRDTLLPVAESALDAIKDKNLNLYKDIHRSKALIHTWLAWQEDPGTPMGLSITKKYLDSSVKECTAFTDWLKELFKA